VTTVKVDKKNRLSKSSIIIYQQTLYSHTI